VSRCFRLGDDLGPFHRLIADDPAYRWIAQRRAGRLLRSPTVFEDLVKMICTTNCSWALTTAMVRNLCNVFGRSFDGARRAFPSPEAIAATSEAFLRRKVKAGYRAPYLLELARAVDSGRTNPELWMDPSLPASEVYGQLRAIKGVGDYAAGNMLKLLGRYEYLGLDSWVRAQYARLHHGGRRVKDSTIARRYRQFGQWRGLLFWLEMTREWYDSKFPLVP
jgi:N-glycosylase/DNA lyase